MQYAYTDGLQTSITAYVDGSTGDQVTTYFYGTTTGTPSAMKLTTGNLLRAVRYPDSSNTQTSTAGIESNSVDVVLFAYNAQGQQTWKKDQYVTSPSTAGGNIIETTYDSAGRETIRAVTTLGTGFDGAVRRVETAYTSLGQVETVTQYDAATSGSLVDQVKYLYDGWGNVTNFRQDIDGTVGGSGYYDVAYAYEKATTGRNTIRRTSETLGGKTFTLNYASSGSPDVPDVSSRVYSIKDGATPLVQYEYLGAGQVVGTMYDEPDVFSRQYSSTAGQYPDLDTLNRVVGSKWTKDLSTDVDFYRYALTYDRNSNITKADQDDDTNDDATPDGHVGFDIAYTMDNLNRLTVADEGTLSGGSITSRTRKQEWTLTQTGNWSLDKLNLNDDADWTDPGEWQDGKTFNKVNEILTRDLDNTSGTTGDNYSLAYDPAGNMTDDGTDYDYEWDAFYRLRKVKTQGGVLVAEYRYNGLGYRIGEHWDVNASGLPVDGSDPWYYSAYDERWRMVATYRSSDSDPKERFVHQQAGDGGYGGSSYIDLVAFREKDANTAWTSASDGTLEERLYYCQNQHADVVALITAAGGQREMDRYSAYGVPFGLPTGDCDSDGDCDTTDRNQVQAWINASNQYDVRGDIDLDGDADSTDKTTLRNNFEGITLGWDDGSCVDVRNSRQSQGGHPAPWTDTLIIHRRRERTALTGVWQARDTAGYMDGPFLYGCFRNNPLRWQDPTGLYSSRCVPDATIYQKDGQYDPEGVTNRTNHCGPKNAAGYGISVMMASDVFHQSAFGGCSSGCFFEGKVNLTMCKTGPAPDGCKRAGGHKKEEAHTEEAKKDNLLIHNKAEPPFSEGPKWTRYPPHPSVPAAPLGGGAIDINEYVPCGQSMMIEITAEFPSKEPSMQPATVGIILTCYPCGWIFGQGSTKADEVLQH